MIPAPLLLNTQAIVAVLAAFFAQLTDHLQRLLPLLSAPFVDYTSPCKEETACLKLGQLQLESVLRLCKS